MESNNEKELETLIHRLREWAIKLPQKVALRYCNDKGKVIASRTYDELNRQTYKIAIELREKYNLTEGSCVMLVFLPCIDFILTFLGCLRAGLVAVPVYPPNPKGIKKNVQLFSGIQENCQAKVALCNGEYMKIKRLTDMKEFFTKSGVKWPELEWINVDSILHDSTLPEVPADEPALHFTGDRLCFLQYTSGSTSLPKGVMITLSALTSNIRIILRALEADDSVVVVSWLPQYHDMGLIGSVLSLLFCGGSGIYLSPISFILSPCLWLQLISQYRATHIQGPNFAYALVLRRLTALPSPSFDLSSLRHIFDAAEPISVPVVRQFRSTLARFGLSPHALTGGYGLAESCVYVSDGGHRAIAVDRIALGDDVVDVKAVLDENDQEWRALNGEWEENETIQLFSCGDVRKNPETTIKIVKNGEDLGENRVGEIYVASLSLAKGYYPNHVESFHKRINGDDKDYLETGDLGFIHDCELYICGRSKDLIIIRGRNLYPQDIEYACHSLPEVKQGSIAAFSIAGEEEESLIVVLELREGSYDASKYDAISKSLRSVISESNGISPKEIVFVAPKTIPKTTSGKISRSRCRDEYLKKSLQEEAHITFADIDVKEESSLPVDVQPMEIEAMNGSRLPGEVDVLPTITESVHNPSESDTVNLPSQLDKVDTCALHGEELESTLLEDVCFLCGIQSYTVTSTDSLEMMSLDSLKRAQLKGILEQYYGAEIDPEFLFDVNTTFEQLVSAVDKQQNRKPIIHTLDLYENAGVGEQRSDVLQVEYKPPERTFCQKFCCQIR